MAIPAFISGAVAVVQGAQTLAGGNSKDGDRLAANQRAYEAAVAGDSNALAFLKQRTGQYGVAYVSGYGEIGGWATEVAKADARQKYAQALQVRQASAVAAQIPGAVQEVAQATGNTVVPFTIKEMVTWAVIAVVVIVAARFLMQQRRRRAA